MLKENLILSNRIRINGTMFPNPFQSLEALEQWLRASKEKNHNLTWGVEEWRGEKYVAVRDEASTVLTS